MSKVPGIDGRRSFFLSLFLGARNLDNIQQSSHTNKISRILQSIIERITGFELSSLP